MTIMQLAANIEEESESYDCTSQIRPAWVDDLVRTVSTTESSSEAMLRVAAKTLGSNPDDECIMSAVEIPLSDLTKNGAAVTPARSATHLSLRYKQTKTQRLALRLRLGFTVRHGVMIRESDGKLFSTLVAVRSDMSAATRPIRGNGR